jgi:BNR repeat-like domain
MLHRRRFLASSVATAAALSLPGLAAGATRRFGKPRAARDADHRVIYRNDGEFCSWPYTMGFFETANSLIVNFQRAKANYGDVASLNHNVVARGGSTLCSARSFDRGLSWDKEPLQEHSGNTLGAHDGSGESILDLGPLDLENRDTLVWTQSSGFGTPDGRPYVRISKDAGRNWSRSYRLPLDGLHSACTNSSQMVRSDGRSLLMLTMVTADGWSRRPMAYLSTPDLATWHFLSFVTPKEDPYGATDGDWAKLASSYAFGGHRWFYPRTVELRSGRILCTLRCQRSPQGDMWSELYYSDDGGRTWGLRSRINDFGAPTSLVYMRDGRLVAVYGYRLPPYGVRAAVSEDEGLTWQPEIILRDDGGSWDLGYPQAIESTKGKVMAAYYFNSRDDRIQADGGVRHIARTIFTPD